MDKKSLYNKELNEAKKYLQDINHLFFDSNGHAQIEYIELNITKLKNLSKNLYEKSTIIKTLK